MTRVSVVGLGKLGVCMAAAMASKGHEVIGVDVNPDTIRKVNIGQAPVIEPHLQDYMTANRNRFMATDCYKDAIGNTNLTFIVVPTPSEDNGFFSIKYAQQAFRSIGQALRDKDTHHTVVLTSTVLPGATRYGCLPALVQECRRNPGDGVSLCYSPEFIALGSVIRDFLNPDILLIGEYDQRSGDILESFYSTTMENEPQIKRMGIENAEMAKISLNSYVTMKITYANTIAHICEKFPGGDCDAVLDAVGADSRVGKKYLRGGLGYGGPCFPRDNQALASFAKSVGIDARLMRMVDAVNTIIPWQIQNNVKKYLVGSSKVLVLGTAYKPDSSLTEESQAFELAKIIAQEHYVHTWDPVAPCTLPEKPDYRDFTHIVLATMDPAFADVSADTLDPGTVVIDLWRSHPHLDNHPQIRYVPIGRCRNDQSATMKIVRGITPCPV